MSWLGELRLHYRSEDGCTRCHDAHQGPLRVLKALYPEGSAICHSVLVHPPGGVVGGDELRLQLELEPDAHALITTPGATRFYRSRGAPAQQSARLKLGTGSRLEWLPLEAIAYTGCEAGNRVEFELAPGAQMLGWDVLALGLPASHQPFEQGRFVQTVHWPGHWLERGAIAADDEVLLHSPLGLAGHRVMATMWWASGSAMPPATREALLDAARAACGEEAVPPSPDATGHPPATGAASLEIGVTSTHEQLVTVRALAHRVEPLMHKLVAVRAAWRKLAWNLAGEPPRLWRT
jgi:urease accessory protein